MPVIADLLEKIRQRPGMYLGERSVTALFHFIGGYSVALGIHGIYDDNTFRLPEDFNDWVAYRLHFYESTSGWKNMILETCRNEATGFTLFFELLDQHATRRSRIVARLSDFHKTYTRTSGGRARREQFPTRIALIAYTNDPGLFAVSDEPGCAFPGGYEYYPSLDSFEAFMGVHRSRLTVVDTESFERWNTKVEPNVAPNDGPGQPPGSSGANEGPPSAG